MTGRLEGRVALISGIATGMGRAGALLFAEEGADVVGLDVDGPGAQQTVDAVVAAGGRADVLVGDASSADDVQAAVALAVSRFGQLDLLWSNAGIAVWKDVVETTEAEWDRVLGVNLKGAYLMGRFGIPELRRAGGGTMVLTGSDKSFVGAPRSAAYTVTKAGVLALCKAMALDHAHENIRVNCVCPGSIATPLLDHAYQAFSGDLSVEEAEAEDRRDHPLGRIGRPEEVAQAALFLSCAESSFTTGSALMVDGGFTAH